MPAQTARMFQHETDESFARVSRSRSDRIRSITYWTFTILLVWELVAGSLWNLQRIEWIRVQLTHLGYPVYLAYILGGWLLGARRRDHRARVPAAQGIGVRGSVFPLLGCGGVAPAGRRLVSYQHVVYSASVFDVRHGVVGAEASRPSAPGYRTRAGNTSSRVGGSDWHPPSVVNRFVSDAPLG